MESFDWFEENGKKNFNAKNENKFRQKLYF